MQVVVVSCLIVSCENSNVFLSFWVKYVYCVINENTN